MFRAPWGQREVEAEVQDGWYAKQDMVARHYAISLSQGEVQALKIRAERDAELD